MKNKIKYLAAVILSAVIMLSCAASAFAYDSLPDLSRSGSISITLTHNDTAMKDGEFTIYKIADATIDNNCLSFVYTSDMQGFGGDANKLNNSKAEQLYSHAMRNNIEGITKTTGAILGPTFPRTVTIELYKWVHPTAIR